MATSDTPATPEGGKANTATSPTFVPNILGPIIDVQLRDSKIVQIHKDVLERSPFFKNALKPEWAESREGRPIDFADENPKIFAGYVSWLYSHNVEIEMGSCNWAKMYVLGEKLMDLEFQDAVLGTVIQESIRRPAFPSGKQINIIYDGTTEKSPARRLLVDFFYYAGWKGWLDEASVMEDPPVQFLKDLVATSLSLKEPIPRGEWPWEKDPRPYFLQKKKEENTKIEG